jgi:TIR domain
MADETQHQDASGTADLSGAEAFRIFLSYRREDASGHAGRLFDFLSLGGVGGEAPGFRRDQIFMDIDTMAPGVDFRRVIAQAVGSCDVFIAVIGKHWLSVVDAKRRRRLDNAQDFVRLEIEAALERDIPVVPALVQGAEMPSVEELPESFHALCDRNAVELSDARWPYDVGRLVAWLKTEEEKKTRRQQAGREQAEHAEREQADRAEHERAEGAERERADQERLERERAERATQADQAQHERADQEEAGLAERERRRFSRKHIFLGAALLALAVAGIASALVLVSGSGESEPTEDIPTTQATAEDKPLPTPVDADGDGLPDAEDPFALDPENGSELPVELRFTDTKADTIKGSGFTGLMTDGTTPYDELFDPDNVIVGNGRFEVTAVDPGRAYLTEDDQRNAFQVGVHAPDESFTAHVSLLEPFADGVPMEPQVLGLFVGTGDQDNFVRLGVGGDEEVKFRVEDGGEGTFSDNEKRLVLPGPDPVDLYLTIDPPAGTIGAEVWATADGETSRVARWNDIPASWIAVGETLAVGIISSRGDAAQFTAVWGPIEVFEGNPP